MEFTIDIDKLELRSVLRCTTLVFRNRSHKQWEKKTARHAPLLREWHTEFVSSAKAEFVHPLVAKALQPTALGDLHDVTTIRAKAWGFRSKNSSTEWVSSEPSKVFQCCACLRQSPLIWSYLFLYPNLLLSLPHTYTDPAPTYLLEMPCLTLSYAVSRNLLDMLSFVCYLVRAPRIPSQQNKYISNSWRFYDVVYMTSCICIEFEFVS